MGGRAKNSKSIGLDIIKNTTTDKYEAREAGITYCMSLSFMDGLKKHYTYFESVEDWYNKLSKADKKEVYRIGLPDDTQYYSDGEFIE